MTGLDQIDHKIIMAIGSGEINVSKMVRLTRLNWQTAYNHLEKLVELGLVSSKAGGFPKTRWLKLSERGVKAYEELRRAALASQTEPVERSIIREELEERIRMLEKYQQLFQGDGAQLLRVPLTVEQVKGCIEALAEGINVAVYPEPESEKGVVVQAALNLLRDLLAHKKFRERTIRTGKLTFVFSLDMGKVDALPNEWEELLSTISFVNWIREHEKGLDEVMASLKRKRDR